MSVPQEVMQQQQIPPQDIDFDALAEEEIGKASSRAARKLIEWAKRDNIVNDIEKGIIEKMKIEILDQYKADNTSMDPWRRKYERAIALCKMESEKSGSYEASGGKDFPFDGAAKVMVPYLMEAVTYFNALMYMEILAQKEWSKPEKVGKDQQLPGKPLPQPPQQPPQQSPQQSPQQPGQQPGQPQQPQQPPPPQIGLSTKTVKEARAQRQSTYLNYILRKESDWKKQTDKQLMSHCLIGTTYKKVYFDPVKSKFESKFVTADKVVFDQSVDTFENAPQIGCPEVITRNELVSNVHFGLWEYDLNKINNDKERKSFDIVEVYFYYDLDDDGYAEPWIATIEMQDEIIMRVRAAFTEEGIHENEGKVYWIDREEFLAQYIMVPDVTGGPMGLGWGILLADIFESINTNLRQLIDAGTIQNAASNSGFIASSLGPQLGAPMRAEEGTLNLTMGRYEQIQVSSGQKLRDSIWQPVSAGPSPVLFELLQFLIDSSKKFTNSIWAIEPMANEAASMYLARIKMAAKVPNAQVGRFLDGMTKEFELFYNAIYKYGEPANYAKVLDEKADIRADFNYGDCDVVPNATPINGTEAERMAKAELMKATASEEIAQGHFDNRKILADYADAAGVEDIDRIMPPQEGPTEFQQQQLQAQMMENEFRNREITVDEAKAENDALEVEIKQSDAELKNKAADIDIAMKAKELQLKDSEIELNQARAAKELAGIPLDEVKLYLEALRDDREDDQRRQQAKAAA